MHTIYAGSRLIGYSRPNRVPRISAKTPHKHWHVHCNWWENRSSGNGGGVRQASGGGEFQETQQLRKDTVAVRRPELVYLFTS